MLTHPVIRARQVVLVTSLTTQFGSEMQNRTHYRANVHAFSRPDILGSRPLFGLATIGARFTGAIRDKT